MARALVTVEVLVTTKRLKYIQERTIWKETRGEGYRLTGRSRTSYRFGAGLGTR